MIPCNLVAAFIVIGLSEKDSYDRLIPVCTHSGKSGSLSNALLGNGKTMSFEIDLLLVTNRSGPGLESQVCTAHDNLPLICRRFFAEAVSFALDSEQ